MSIAENIEFSIYKDEFIKILQKFEPRLHPKTMRILWYFSNKIEVSKAVNMYVISESANLKD